MKKIIYQMLTGCYIVAALVLVAACNDGLDIQTKYPFTVEKMPVPKKLKVNETAEIRCELKREGRWKDADYTIRWFLYDGKGTLKLDDGTVLLPNERYPLEKELFRLYFTSLSDEQSSLKVWVEDTFGKRGREIAVMEYSKYLGSNRSDEKYTPRYAVLPIIKYLSQKARVWCPFDTEHSEFVLALKEHKFKVVHSHICTGQDFFEYEPERWDVIVSNPPFSNKLAVFERCLGFGKPFALLMSNFWLNDSAPCRLFKDKELELLLFDKRVQYNDLNRVPFGSSYFCHRVLPKQIIFENLTVEKKLSRMHNDMDEIVKSLTKCRDKIEWKKK